MLSIAVGCLHRLITYNALASDKSTIGAVFAVLGEAVSSSDETQLKALQCIMPLLTNAASAVRGEDLVQAYLIGFRLHESKSPMVNNAAVAIVRQLIIWLFEQVAEEDGSQSPPPSDGSGAGPSYARDALVIFQDICLLLNDEKAQVLTLLSIDKSFALDLIESVLAYHSRIFRDHPEYVVVIREKICTTAVKQFTEGASFPQACRLWRVVGILLREFHDLLKLECEIFISFLPRILEEETGKPEWERTLVLEMARDIFADHALLLELYRLCDGRGDGPDGPKVFQDLVLAITRQVLRGATRAGETSTVLCYGQTDMKVSLLSQFDKAQAPPVPPFYSLHLAFDTLALWLRGALPPAAAPGGGSRELLEAVWDPLLKCLLLLLATSMNGDWKRLVFENIEVLGKLFGHLGLAAQLKRLLEELSELRPAFHALAWQTSLLIALDNPEAIGEAWPVLVAVLHLVDVYTGMKASKISYSTAATAPVPVGALESPLKKGLAATLGANGSSAELDLLAQLSDLCRLLMESSVRFSPATFALFMRALAVQAVLAKADLFLIRRFKQATLLNIARLFDGDNDEAWGLIQSNLMLLLASDDVQIRAPAVEFLHQLVQTYASAVDTAAFEADVALQVRVLALLGGTRGAKRDVHLAAMEMTGKLIQTLGPSFAPQGWQLCFGFIRATLEQDCDMPLLRSAFYCVKLVAADFLACLDSECMAQALGLVSMAARQRDDLNISLTAIGLLWDVSDYLRLSRTKASRLTDVFALWLRVLETLMAASVEPRPELRNSAVQTLTRTVELFALSLEDAEWTGLFEQVILVLLEDVMAAAESVVEEAGGSAASLPQPQQHHSRDTAQKQWDETLVLATQGMVKIFTEFGGTLLRLEPFAAYWGRLLGLLGRACRSAKSIEVVSVGLACFHHVLKSIAVPDDATWGVAWAAWRAISEQMVVGAASYTQESLELFVSCYALLYPRIGSLARLRESFGVLDAVLKCPTPGDVVRDVEGPSDLQSRILAQLEVIDWEHWGLDGTVLLIETLGAWMALPPELRSMEMTRAASVRRARHSAAPSRPTSPLLPAQGATFIGLSVRLLGLLEASYAGWRDTAGFYDEAYPMLLLAVGRLMVLKYRAASAAAGEPTWRRATDTFTALFRATPKALLTEHCWQTLVQVLEKTLESSRRMVPVHLAVDQLTSDEDFDILLVRFIKDGVLPEMVATADTTVATLLVALEQSSQLYYSKVESPVLTAVASQEDVSGVLRFATPLASPSHELIPVIKERFAIACLQSLFQISMASPETSLHVPKVALRILMARVKRVVDQFVAEKRLQGNMPFPRIRQDEMLFVLQASLDMRLPLSLAADSLLQGGAGSEMKRALLDMDIGHLFYLYPSLCSAMEISDHEVSALVRACFTAIGRAAGLV